MEVTGTTEIKPSDQQRFIAQADEPNKEGSEAERLEAQKKALEVAKLALELQTLRTPWRSPSFWVSTVTPLIALIGLGIGFYSGFFDAKRTLLDIEVRELAQKKHSFIAAISHEIIVQVETFFLRDLNQVLQGGWLYDKNQGNKLSAEMFPEFFSLAAVSPEFLHDVQKHLAQVAWDSSYDVADVNAAVLRPPLPSPADSSMIGDQMVQMTRFECPVSLRFLLGGSAAWLRGHALECSSGYMRKTGDTNYSDMMRLRERHRLVFREKFVKQFPPLQIKLKELAVEHKLPEEEIWALGVANQPMRSGQLAAHVSK